MRWTVALLSSLALLPARPLAAQLPPLEAAYSAESVLELGEETIVGRSYVDRGLERHETSIDGLEQVTIVRPDLDRAFVGQPGLEELIELPIEEVALLPPVAALAGYQATEEGRETLDGEPATRYRLSDPMSDLGPPEMTVWMTDDGVLLQIAAEVIIEGEAAPVVLTHRNVVRGEQDPMLFDPLYRPIADEAAPGRVVMPRNWGTRGP